MFLLPKPTNELRRMTFGDYTILKYTKPLSVPALGVYRSVVQKAGVVVAVAPPRAIDLADFMCTYNFDQVYVDEFVDGTMINVFFDATWVVCTKSNVGGHNGFYENAPSFAEMFYAALIFKGLTLDALDKRYVYSFVLQHPSNRIVVRVDLPTVYLVKVYAIAENQVTEMPIPDFGDRPKQILAADSYEMLLNRAQTMSFNEKGFMLHAPDGTRAKIVGHQYTRMGGLRGLGGIRNGSSTRLRLLELRNSSELDECLLVFPEFKAEMDEVRREVASKTNALYSMYLECFRNKAKPLVEYPRGYKPHLYALHQLYLRDWPTPIHKKRVVEYVKTLNAFEIDGMK